MNVEYRNMILLHRATSQIELQGGIILKSLKTIISIMVLACMTTAAAQVSDKQSSDMRKAAPTIFLDGYSPDIDYVRTEIQFVNFVRDKFEADIHVIITELPTASGGTEYTYNFIGQRKYSAVNDTIKYYSQSTATPDEIRKGFTNALKAGILRFMIGTPYMDHITIGYDLKAMPEAPRDKWDYWTFLIAPSFRYSTNNDWEIQKNSNSRIYLSANRITDASKTGVSLDANYNDDRSAMYYDYGPPANYYSSLFYTAGSRVFSFGDHFSAGAFGSVSYQKYGGAAHTSNLSNQIGPQIEYDVFPYYEFTRRRFYIDYSVFVNYYRTRYFSDVSDHTNSRWHYSEELSANYIIKQPWGSFSAGIAFSNNLEKLVDNQLSWSASVYYRLIEGLNLSLSANGTRHEYVHNYQHMRYSNTVMFGINYSFGNIYSNVVNPRMSF